MTEQKKTGLSRLCALGYLLLSSVIASIGAVIALAVVSGYNNPSHGGSSSSAVGLMMGPFVLAGHVVMLPALIVFYFMAVYWLDEGVATFWRFLKAAAGAATPNAALVVAALSDGKFDSAGAWFGLMMVATACATAALFWVFVRDTQEPPQKTTTEGAVDA